MSDFEPLENTGPYLDHVGPLQGHDGVIGIRVEPHHLNAAGSVHGGFLASIADHALGRAVNGALEDAGAVTVSLTTDYLGPAEQGQWLEATTNVERLGGSLAFADCTITADGEEIVRARGVFAVLS